MMRGILLVCTVVLIGVQYSLWFGQSGYFARERLQAKVDTQAERVEVLQERNKILLAEVVALKGDNKILESRARRDLGMVKRGEIFYLIPATDL